MNDRIMQEANGYAARRRRRHIWQKIMGVLAAVVVLATAYALILPAITMEKTGCTLPEHTHTPECWTKIEQDPTPVCTLESLQLHRHTASCLNENGDPVCGESDFVVHTHDSSCYDADGRRWCPLPEIKTHTHGASCYAPAEEAHVHDESCYSMERGALICTEPEREPHAHDESCYEEHQNRICTLEESEGHRHADGCYDESGALICELEESDGHRHTDACYETVRELVCGLEETEGHQHTDACYEQNPVLTCTLSTEPAEPQLICNREEIRLHTHTSACYDRQGARICGMQEVLEHVHSDACFASSEDELTCTIPEGAGAHAHGESCYNEAGELICGLEESEGHRHGATCYGTWELTCGLEEHSHSRDDAAKDNATPTPDASIAPEDTPESTIVPDDTPVPEDTPAPDDTPVPEDESTLSPDASIAPEGDSALDGADALLPDADSADAIMSGRLNLSLKYGDSKAQSEHPDGVSYSVTTPLTSFLCIEPQELTDDLTDVTVTLSVPKQYVRPNSLTIPDFTTSSASAYEMIPLHEDGDSYVVGIHFSVYDKTQALTLPFLLNFLDNTVPDNYVLPVTGSIAYGDTTARTEPNLYRPQYEPWEITKFVNTNNLSSFGNDGAEAVVTPQEPDGNPYLDDLTYIDFQFLVCTRIYGTTIYYQTDERRDVCSMTLTDTLPTYTDVSGNSRIAKFDPERNPGWTLSEDGTTISRTYTGENTLSILKQIREDVIHLQFPGLPFKKGADGFLIADLTNSVHMDAIPTREAEGETRPTADDSLLFRLTSKSGTEGRFTKGATKGDIYDGNSYKANEYPWELHLYNEHPQPLEHIVIQDREIVEDGKTVVAGLDKRLKFTRLEFRSGASILPEGKTYADIVDHVTAWYADGGTESYTLSGPNNSGNFTVTFDADRICEGYEVVFKDDYAMELNGSVSLYAYTVYRDPQNTHVDETDEAKNLYANGARSVNWQEDGEGSRTYFFLSSSDRYKMLPYTEELRIIKNTGGNEVGNTVGSSFFYVFNLSGSLLEPEVKQYENLRIIDLLPPELSYTSISLGKELFGNLNKFRPEIIENYHNSGRTALIFPFKAEDLKEYWKTNSGAPITIHVRINGDAKPGTVRNYVYVVGDNLDEYTGATGGTEDIYDLNDNGRTDDKIACGYSDAIIVAAESLYAEKFIAPAGSSNWTKQGLNVKVGSAFDYLLKVTNDMSGEYTGLIVYDALPNIGDMDVFKTNARQSEFPVRLRGAITPPAGYQVYYTTSPDALTKSMDEMLADDSLWVSSVSDYSSVTAFKLVADEGAKLGAHSSFEARIPVCAAGELSEESMALLAGKSASHLDAINDFGFKTAETTNVMESNTVWARIPFAEFTLKKVDAQTGDALRGAVFTLTDANGDVVQTQTSNDSGLLRFSDLTEGHYTLAETRVPSGYRDAHIAIDVDIEQNAITLDYKITFSGAFAGSGTAADPLVIENQTGHELPQTGGPGVLPFYIAGALLIAAALLLARRRAITGR